MICARTGSVIFRGRGEGDIEIMSTFREKEEDTGMI